MPSAVRVPVISNIQFQFTLCPRRASAGAIRAANRRRARSGASTSMNHASADVEIARIRAQRSASKERVRSWLSHPDERVVVAVIASHHRLPHSWIDSIGNQALLDADRRGLLWTPIIDRIACFDSGFTSVLIERATALASAVADCPDARVLSSVLRFRAPILLAAVTAVSTQLTPRLLRGVPKYRAVEKAFVTNVRLSATCRLAVGKWIVSQIVRRRLGRKSELPFHVQCLAALVACGHGALPTSGLNVLVKRLQTLRHMLPPAECALLEQIVVDCVASRREELHPDVLQPLLTSCSQGLRFAALDLFSDWPDAGAA